MSEQHPTTTRPAGKELALRVVPMPADANQHGDIFGGWITEATLTCVAVDEMRRPRPVPTQR